MNKEQKICLWVGIGLIVLITLFPPYCWRSGKYGGFGLLWRYMESDDGHPLYIDKFRLSIQLAVVAVVTTGLILTFKDKKTNSKSNET